MDDGDLPGGGSGGEPSLCKSLCVSGGKTWDQKPFSYVIGSVELRLDI